MVLLAQVVPVVRLLLLVRLGLLRHRIHHCQVFLAVQVALLMARLPRLVRLVQLGQLDLLHQRYPLVRLAPLVQLVQLVRLLPLHRRFHLFQLLQLGQSVPMDLQHPLVLGIPSFLVILVDLEYPVTLLALPVPQALLVRVARLVARPVPLDQ